MRIIGGKDYYDGALAYGHDTHTTFVRGNESIGEAEAAELGIEPSELRARLVPAGGEWRRGQEIFRNHSPMPARGGGHFLLGFPTVIACGRRYRGVRAELTSGATYFWSADRFAAWIAEQGFELHFSSRHRDLESYFSPAEPPRAALERIVERRWTLLVHDPKPIGYLGRACDWLIDQPVLRGVEFFKAVPPHLLFQEIDMWLGGRLPGAGRPMVELSDQDRLAKHGMDRTSFRRPKSS